MVVSAPTCVKWSRLTYRHSRSDAAWQRKSRVAVDIAHSLPSRLRPEHGSQIHGVQSVRQLVSCSLCRNNHFVPPLQLAFDSCAGLVSSTNRLGWATKVAIFRVQALRRHTRQEAASAITQSPEGPHASGAKRSGTKPLEASSLPRGTKETETGRRRKPATARRGRA